jgi:hypothetical protein
MYYQSVLRLLRQYDRTILYIIAPLVVLLHIVCHDIPVVPQLCITFYMAISTRSLWSIVLGDVWDKFTECLTATFIEVRQNINDALKPENFSFRTLAVNFDKHKIGISACVKTAVNETKAINIGLEAVKVGSMLGLEQTIMDNLLAKLTSQTLTGDIAFPIEQHHDIEGLVPIIAGGAAILGKEIGGLDPSHFLDKYAKNVKNIEVLQNHIQKGLEIVGYRSNPCHSTLLAINRELVELKEEISWAVVVLATRPNIFLTSENDARLRALYSKTEAISTRLNTITDSKLRAHKLSNECSQMVRKVEDVWNQVKIMKEGYNIRPCPVGIAIVGESQIGKTEIMPELMKRVKDKLSIDPENPFPDVKLWQTWHVQNRDEFDTGYTGQEITYMDDAFQQKDNEDHKKWITFISSEPVGTVQASLVDKGKPFASRICALTANIWPRTSLTIQTVDALHGRFPVSIHAQLKEGLSPPARLAEYDGSFSWLEFRMATMIEHASNRTQDLPVCSLDTIVDNIVSRLIINERKYQAKIVSLQTIQLHMDSFDESSEEEYIEEELTKEEYKRMMEVNVGPMISRSALAAAERAQMVKETTPELEREQRNRQIAKEMVNGTPPVATPRRGRDGGLIVNLSVEQEVRQVREVADVGAARLVEENRPENIELQRQMDDVLRDTLEMAQEEVENINPAIVQTGSLWNRVIDRSIQAVFGQDNDVRTNVTPRVERIPNVEMVGFMQSQVMIHNLLDEVSRQCRTAISGEAAQWININSWALCLRRRETHQSLADYQLENTEDVCTFIATLGAWEVDPEKLTEFNDTWRAQPVIKLESDGTPFSGIPYLWGPLLNRGRTMVGLNQELIDYLTQPDMPVRERRSFLLWLFNNRRTIAEAVYTVATIGIAWRAPTFASNLMMATAAFRIRRQFYQPGDVRYRSLFSYWDRMSRGARVIMVTTPVGLIAALDHAYSYMEDVMARCSSCMQEQILRLLEYLGVDVSPLWHVLIDISTKVVVRGALVFVAATLVYLLYKLIVSYFKGDDKEKVTESEAKKFTAKLFTRGSSSVYSHSKGNKELSRAKVTKQAKINKINLHHDTRKIECAAIDCSKTTRLLKQDLWLLPNEHGKRHILDGEVVGEVIQTFMLEKEKDMNYQFSINFVDEVHPYLIAKVVPDEYRVESAEGFRLIKLNRISYEDKLFVRLGIEMECEFVTRELDLVKHLDHWFQIPEKFQSYEFVMKIHVSKIKGVDEYHVYIQLFSPSANINGVKRGYTHAVLKPLTDTYQHYNKIKIDNSASIEDIIEEPVSMEEHGNTEQSISSVVSVVKKHQVYFNSEKLTLWDTDILVGGSFALGHERFLIHVAHNIKKGQVIRWWRGDKPTKADGYRTALVLSTDYVRDIGVSCILTTEQLKRVLGTRTNESKFLKLSNVNDSFPSLLKHLLPEDSCRNAATTGEAIIYLPKSKIMTTGMIVFSKVAPYSLEQGTVPPLVTDREYHRVSNMKCDVSFSNPGDCGGVYVVAHGSYKSKVIGFHAGCNPVLRYWLGSILSREDVKEIEKLSPPVQQHMEEYRDSWQSLIIQGKPTDIPQGSAVTFVGKFKKKTLPAVSTSLEHWNLSPWASQFEEVLAPSPLSSYDDRITAALPINELGEPSLLLNANNVLAVEVPEMDQEALDYIGRKFVEEQTHLLKDKLRETPDDVEDLLHHALNGFNANEFVGGIELNKAAGVPWCYYRNCNKKKDFIDMDEEGVRQFNGTAGSYLKQRVVQKLYHACKGKRILSFSNSKLKDATIKLSSIEKGKTRVFHCIPVDKIVLDAALFGCYKEVYSASNLALNHGIGIDPHSLGWRAIFEKITQHANVFDADFEHYDKRLNKQVMMLAYSIIDRVIQNLKPDKYSMARKILAQEAIETLVIDYDTVYQTTRGNKSGEYMTTVINCLVNDIYSYYTWIKVTGFRSFSEFRTNVSEIFFGDDRLSSVSDLYKDRYNYCSFKKVMEEIGHVVTPGDKSQDEKPFIDINEVQFLKRRFRIIEGMVVGPLNIDSIESPFVWTRIHPTEKLIWYNLVKEQRFEALLHGQAYYDLFIEKLRSSNDSSLQEEVNRLLLDDYGDLLMLYKQTYYGR